MAWICLPGGKKRVFKWSDVGDSFHQSHIKATFVHFFCHLSSTPSVTDLTLNMCEPYNLWLILKIQRKKHYICSQSPVTTFPESLCVTPDPAEGQNHWSKIRNNYTIYVYSSFSCFSLSLYYFNSGSNFLPPALVLVTAEKHTTAYTVFFTLGEHLAALCLTPHNLCYIRSRNREKNLGSRNCRQLVLSEHSTDHHNKDERRKEREKSRETERESECDKPALFQATG